MAILINTSTVNLSSTGIVSMNGSPSTNTTTQPFTGLAVFAKTIMSITSNATLSVDSNLSLMINETGIYTIDGFFAMYPTTNGAGGFQIDLGGGTATVNTIRWTATASNGAVATIGTTVTGNADSSRTTAFKLAALSSLATIANSNWVLITGVMTVNAAGTFIPRWAQNGSNANTTNRAANSCYIILKKIG